MFLIFQNNRINDYVIEKPLNKLKFIEDIIFNELLLFLNINPKVVLKQNINNKIKEVIIKHDNNSIHSYEKRPTPPGIRYYPD